MRITKFEIENFKGVKNLTIELPVPGQNSVVTLIGLNESGKTTILEAISNFLSSDENVSSLYAGQISAGREGAALDDKIVRMIPKDQRANFNGQINIIGYLSLDDDDVEKLYDTLLPDITIQKSSLQREIKVYKSFIVEDSKLVEIKRLWSFAFYAKTGKQRKFWYNKGDEDGIKQWRKVVSVLALSVPKVVFFPTFLFEIPEKIYLDQQWVDQPQIELYRGALQNILDSRGDGMTIEKHIIGRIVDGSDDEDEWLRVWSRFLGSSNKDSVDAVLQKMSSHLSSVVFSSWERIFGRRVTSRRIELSLGSDPDQNGRPFIQFIIIDGSEKYYLHERSLGFRWFFSFLLFTQFASSGSENSSLIFLLDEPASNLHAKAQMELVESFPKITKKNSTIIYSTHSMYMIDPKYLENSYIVENKAQDYDEDMVDFDFERKATDIIAEKYKSFVGSYPERVSYFQPVLDHLAASVSPIEMPKDVVLLEGKGDFYVFEYWKKANGSNLSFFPGVGAFNLEATISLALGFGRKFVVLADDDEAGREAVSRYQREFFNDRIAITYSDLSEQFSGWKLENILSTECKAYIKRYFSVDKLQKKHIAMFFSQQLSTKEYVFDEQTMLNIRNIILPVEAWLSG